MAEILDTTRIGKLKARASYVGAAVNVFQTLVKIGFGILGQSAALIADGIHSLKQQCDLMKIKVKKINNITLFFRHNED